jgi:hypothetical protein
LNARRLAFGLERVLPLLKDRGFAADRIPAIADLTIPWRFFP